MSTISERRDRQRESLVEAAERQIAVSGVASLKARDLAREVGIALGAIYNLVDDMDELVLRVTIRTLARLDVELDAMRRQAPADPVDALVALAVAYRAFASSNLHLWRTLFEHRMAADKIVPDWHVEQQMRLFRHIEEPLAELRPGWPEDRRRLFTRTLFSAVHGVVSLGLEEKLVAVPLAELDRQIEELVRAVCRGAPS